MTAERANKRLVDMGLLELTMPSTPTLSNVWKLLTPPDLAPDGRQSASPQNIENDIQAAQLNAHDAFRRAGLGKSGAEVLLALQENGVMSVAEVVTATGRHPSTVRRKLDKMRQLGLVEPLGDGKWLSVNGPDMDLAAAELGTAGTGERQKQRHAYERQRHRRALQCSSVGAKCPQPAVHDSSEACCDERPGP
jgi:DNA-binding transcriptional ArsR family regulator